MGQASSAMAHTAPGGKRQSESQRNGNGIDQAGEHKNNTCSVRWCIHPTKSLSPPVREIATRNIMNREIQQQQQQQQIEEEEEKE